MFYEFLALFLTQSMWVCVNDDESCETGTFDCFITDSLNRSTETEERAANKNLEFMYSLRRRMALTQSQTQAHTDDDDDDDGTYTCMRANAHTIAERAPESHVMCCCVDECG